MPPADEIDAPPAIRSRLHKLGIERREDLVLHLPLRYEDETRVTALAEAPLGVPLQIEALVGDVAISMAPRRQLLVTVSDACDVADAPSDTDEKNLLRLRFLSFYGSQQRAFENARQNRLRLRIFGEIRDGFLGLEMVHPRYRILSTLNALSAATTDEALPQSLTPVYPTTAGLAQGVLRKLIARAMRAVDLSELLDANWCAAHRLPALAAALGLLHSPPPELAAVTLQSRSHPAWRRIKFDELMAQQLSLRRAYLARRRKGAPLLLAAGRLAASLLAALPFALTDAQQRVAGEIGGDLEQPFPMQRLLQGDVGCGKTIVAAMAICQTIEAGYQAALMAPTEILAEQHFLKLRAWLEPLGVEVVCLSGRLGARSRRALRQQAATSAQLVVGTHALIQEGLDFARLGLAIIDEQHRFGVVQRLDLRRKGGNPHQLMMSATPIPRTLAMSYYADLDVSLIDEMPAGRSPVRTRLFSDARREEVTAAVRGVVAAGRQAYWVCPLIEESAKLQLQAALDTYTALLGELAGLRIGLVHGRLSGTEKAAVMAAFVAGQIDVLVATTVIEVGVDVANASLMVIEHAERFGLAQLHQLRGRVGRGTHDSLCVLLYQQPLSAMARARLKIIFEHTDGFEIARQDLRLRGPGEFVGSRQSGVPLLRYADLEADADLVELAREMAVQLLRNDPACAERHLRRWLGNRDELLKA
ncbi:MAG: ATP-dependent DNA helicase RecG [Candidatus Accumulibacter appositus]|uniref:ATP-dependent DNA helicase RecG n=1 Tax=Candidatus Accumulibacter appositus TaxID=1454003 RepID=A0A011NS40_9PROT|nr:ATP-dependent DNA helicase RecG [Accumulibacter sp.]EXI78156.1 MAG: ATP-dependent DNA helicase RecG [Candidatus Accumulibacter appositus]HRF04718.1 ATP-dependent DNA helicase RecG [Accumulibacter sp.]